MEQREKKQEDVLAVHDEKTGEINVVAELDDKDYPNTKPVKPEHSQDFLHFDCHGDMADNFFKNFYHQYKELTCLDFYRVTADAADALLPVVKDFLKDPVANAEILASHKVDTTKYQQQAETENVKQEKNNSEPIKKTEEMEKKEELKQGKDVQQPRVAGTQERPNLITDDQVNWEELRKYGIDKEELSEKSLKAPMNYGKTGLVTIGPTFGYESYELQVRLSSQKMEDDYLKLTLHLIRNEPCLDTPHRDCASIEEDKKTLKRMGNLGKPVNFTSGKTGGIKPHYISIDRLTNEIVDIPVDRVRIPNKIEQTNLSREEQDVLRAGLPLSKEVMLSNKRKSQALLQVNANKHDVEFVSEQPRQQQSQRQGDGQDEAQGNFNSPQQSQGEEDGNNQQRHSCSQINEDGSIRPIKEWKDDVFTNQQIAGYVAGKTAVLINAKDDQGQPRTKYPKFNFEKGRPLTYSQSPDLAQIVASSDKSRAQLTVNNGGKINEVTKHVEEPLQRGQTIPKSDAQQKQQVEKSKGMKVPS